MNAARVIIHPSQFPEAIRRDLLESLRTRRVNPKFHYDSVKQTQKWLAVHQAYSPSRTDPDCAAMYDRAFAAATARVTARRMHLLGLGCGGGQKDTRLLQRLSEAGYEVSYTPCDVSVAMTLVARQTAHPVVADSDCVPLVCDLATAEDLPTLVDQLTPPDAVRLITFFGMIPNFEPAVILPRLAALLRPGDWLLASANLAPGPDYAAGVRQIMPQYDNPLTREWLRTLLLDLGIERGDGHLHFGIATDESGLGLLRVVADFRFEVARTVTLENERFEFRPGDSLRVFFSYRLTPGHMRALLQARGLEVREAWIAAADQEGVFIATRRAA